MALAFVGALGDRRKGFDVLFAAFQMLAKESDWDVDLVVVGTGATVPLWRERAERSGLAERVRGDQMGSEIVDLISNQAPGRLPSSARG